MYMSPSLDWYVLVFYGCPICFLLYYSTSATEYAALSHIETFWTYFDQTVTRTDDHLFDTVKVIQGRLCEHSTGFPINGVCGDFTGDSVGILCIVTMPYGYGDY